jgi:CheY-like chemotaxis protein
MGFEHNYYFFKVPGLMVPKTVEYDAMNNAVNKYIDRLPLITASIESNLANKKKEALINDIEQVIPFLKDVYSKWLESDANSLIRALNHPGVRIRDVTALVSSLNSLSIEMQRAQRRAEEKELEKSISAAEKHADTANALAASAKLFDDCEYNAAESLITDIAEFNKNLDLSGLLNLLVSKDYNKAAEMVKTLIEKENEAIEQSAGTDLSKKILAVDDRPEILSFVSNALKNHYKVFGAASGLLALKILEIQKPDLFVLDIDMPEMDGYELAAKIRSNASYKDTPIIFLTGNSSREHVMRAIQVGANDFIVKPTSHEALLSKAGKYLA